MPSKDITVQRPIQPKYNINQTVYSRASATKGYMQPFFIHHVHFEQSSSRWLYSFRRKMNIIPTIQYQLNERMHNNATILQSDILPIQLYEDQILTFCEAITIQKSVLQGQYEEAVKVLQEKCGGQLTSPPKPIKVYENATFQIAI